MSSHHDPANEPRRFFFMHLQKTAGTALWGRLKRHFEPAEVYPGPGDGEPPLSVLTVDHLVERWRARRDEIRIVTGHFPLCVTDLLDARFTTLTVLREPVERTLSFLRHHREMTPADRDRPLEEIYEEPLRRELVHNHMVKMLSLTAEEMTDGALTHVEFSREHLERARERLDGMDVVGFQEQFEEFCAELERRFGWDLGDPVVANRTERVEVSEAFRARIASDNALDTELYEFARSTFDRSGRGPSAQ